MPGVSFDRFDVVVVPFPFTDRDASLRRPALVLSDKKFVSDCGSHVLAMITRAARSNWPLDVPLTDVATAGLAVECRVRMKLFTLDTNLVLKRAGRLGKRDAHAVTDALARLFGLNAAG